MLPTDKCVVYWLFDDQCVCPWRHGYVGVSCELNKRLKNHRRRQRRDFDVKILFEGTQVECRIIEYQFRSQRKIGWNIGIGGGKNRFGIPHNEETKQKMRDAIRPPILETTREKLRITSIGRTNRGRIGQKKSDEERAKISASKKGKKQIAEHTAKIAWTKIGNQYRLGHNHSEETKQIIRMKKTGIAVHSVEHKKKLAKRMKGNAYTRGKPWSAARRLAWLANRQEVSNADQL